MTRTQMPDWKLTVLFPLVLIGASVAPLSAQSSSVEQVWNQLQNQFTTVHKTGYKQLNYLIGWLNNGDSPATNWPVDLTAGTSVMIIGVCDNDCTDVDLVLEDRDRVVLASDTAADDLPLLRFTPDSTATYWIKPTMHACQVNPCGYGIGVFVQ